MMLPPLRWNDDQFCVDLFDQTLLPVEEKWLDIFSPDQMAEAINMLRVRGAPAIGIAAAYGTVLALRDQLNPRKAIDTVEDAIDLLAGTRPTAVNLFWALRRMRHVVENSNNASAEALRNGLLAEAKLIHSEDLDAGRKLGTYGLSLLQDGMTVMTHCNAGGMATSGYGTALAPLLLSVEKGFFLKAIVNETRPLLQGSRITAWELKKAGVPVTLITDSMAGYVMQQGFIDAVFVGADRIAENGDVANKIGTYALAVLARTHDIPFYVAAPVSTIDFNIVSAAEINIEERKGTEITHAFGRQTAPDGISIYNPAFDKTPATLVTAIITEYGIVRPPFKTNLRLLPH